MPAADISMPLLFHRSWRKEKEVHGFKAFGGNL